MTGGPSVFHRVISEGSLTLAEDQRLGLLEQVVKIWADPEKMGVWYPIYCIKVFNDPHRYVPLPEGERMLEFSFNGEVRRFPLWAQVLSDEEKISRGIPLDYAIATLGADGRMVDIEQVAVAV